MFLSIDGTFFIQLLNFAIFFAVLRVVFLQPVGRAIATRRAYINSVTEDYDRYQAEAAELRARAENVRAEARREAEHIIAKARADASNEAARIATESGEKAADVVREAQETVASELRAAREYQARMERELADLIVRRAVPELAQ